MDALTSLVSDTLARNGFSPKLDYRRLQWSKWFRCDSSFSTLLVPSKPGLFALGEEMIAPGEIQATGGKRLLGVFQITEADDLGMALGRLFLPGSPQRERMMNNRCFARYAVIEDVVQRRAASTALANWLATAAETVSGMATEFPQQPGAVHAVSSVPDVAGTDSENQASMEDPGPLPSGF
jgi:hypothetical protein